ncbi:MAG: helix-turn-helix domain-containing protein [Clostridia bacterium]|nr:helix-turn-helix domain-containing protein [Clostridia bacterium]
MIKCELKQINRVKHSIPIKIKTHTHRANELTYFISGSGTTKINDEIFYYKPGNFAFYKMGTPHNEYDPVSCDIIWMHFDFDIDDIELKEGVFYDNDGKLLKTLQKLRNLSLEQIKYKKQLIESTLSQVIVYAAQKQENNDEFSKKINWKQILNYIDSNINENINFKTLSLKYNYSYDRFRHLFTEHFGISPNSYLTNQRINHAKRLLKSSDASITDIAYDCGFNSSSQFTNIFKKYVGITPKEYRNN